MTILTPWQAMIAVRSLTRRASINLRWLKPVRVLSALGKHVVWVSNTLTLSMRLTQMKPQSLYTDVPRQLSRLMIPQTKSPMRTASLREWPGPNLPGGKLSSKKSLIIKSLGYRSTTKPISPERMTYRKVPSYTPTMSCISLEICWRQSKTH